MKNKTIWIGALILLVIILPSLVQAAPLASISVSEVECPDECIEGKAVHFFDINIKNTGESTFIIRDIMIKDEDGNIMSAAGFPSDSTVVAGDERTIERADGYLPPPTSDSTLYYRIYAYIEEEQWYGNSHTVIKSKKLSMEVKPPQCTNCGGARNPMCTYECCDDSDCGENEYCGGHHCWQVKCYCGEIKNHECVNYECCKDSNCQEDYYCSKNNCVECLKDLDCDFDQYCSQEKKCTQLNCDYTQYSENHKCLGYECMDNLSCSYDKYCSDHECNKLDCDFGYPKDHKCISYWRYIMIIILVVIVAILISLITYSKIKKKKKK